MSERDGDPLMPTSRSHPARSSARMISIYDSTFVSFFHPNVLGREVSMKETSPRPPRQLNARLGAMDVLGADTTR